MKSWSEQPSQEALFDLWVKELQDRDFIVEYIQMPKPITLVHAVEAHYSEDRVVYKGTKREKTVTDNKKRTLFRDMTYKADRIIIWNHKMKDILFQDINMWQKEDKHTPFYAHFAHSVPGWVTYVDVKSPFQGKNCSDATFDVKKKIIWEKMSIYVDKTILYPLKKRKSSKGYLWLETFTPERFTWSDKLTKKRTIRNWKPVLIDQFLKAKGVSV